MLKFLDKLALNWLSKREPFADLFTHRHAVRSAICCANNIERNSPDWTGFFQHELKVHDRLDVALKDAGVM